MNLTLLAVKAKGSCPLGQRSWQDKQGSVSRRSTVLSRAAASAWDQTGNGDCLRPNMWRWLCGFQHQTSICYVDGPSGWQFVTWERAMVLSSCNPTGIYPPPGTSPSLAQLQHALTAGIKMSSCTQAHWITRTGVGAHWRSPPFTRWENELLDQLGNKRIIFHVTSWRCRSLYRCQAKLFIPPSCDGERHLQFVHLRKDCMNHKVHQPRSQEGLPKVARNWQSLISNIFKIDFLLWPCP